MMMDALTTGLVVPTLFPLPDTHRARVPAFRQLGFSGGAPAGLFFFSPLWRYRAAEG